MSLTATIVASLASPLAAGQVNASPPFGATVPVSFVALIPGETIPITGAQTYVVDLAMMPAVGLTGLVVVMDRADANGGAVTAPVKVVFTSGFVWLPPGGAMSIAAPSLASGGITSLSLVTTANAVVHVGACG